MIRKNNLFCFLLTQILFFSCSSIIKFNVNYPPLVDIHNIKTITVIPLEWKTLGAYNYLAKNLTKSLITGVRRANRANSLNFIDPEVIRNVDRNEYWKYVDVILEAGILDVSTKDISYVTEEDNKISRLMIERTVQVNIVYKYIRTKDNIVIGEFERNAFHSISFQDALDNVFDNVFDFVLNGTLVINPSTYRRSSKALSIQAVKNFHTLMGKDIYSYTINYRKTFLDNTKNNYLLQGVRELVRRKNYYEALVLIKKIYETTDDIVIGYNTVLLLEANNQFHEALALAEEIDEKIRTNRMNSPFNIKKEIDEIKKIINILRL